MYVKKDAAIDTLLEYVGPCSIQVPVQPDWEHFGDQGVEDLINGLSKLAAKPSFWPKPMGPPKSYKPEGADSNNQSSSSSSGVAPSALDVQPIVRGHDTFEDAVYGFNDHIGFLEAASVGESVRRYVFLLDVYVFVCSFIL